MENSEIVMRANEFVSSYELKAEIFEGINSVGVAGDAYPHWTIPRMGSIGKIVDKNNEFTPSKSSNFRDWPKVAWLMIPQIAIL